MRWIVSVGTLVLVGLAVGLGLAGTLSGTSLPQSSGRIAFRGEEGDCLQPRSVSRNAGCGARTTNLRSWWRARSIGRSTHQRPTRLLQSRTSQEVRNAMPLLPSRQTRRTAMRASRVCSIRAELVSRTSTKRKLRTSRTKGASYPYRSSGPERNHQFTWCRENNSDRPQSDCRRSRRWCFVSQLAAGCRSMRSHAPLICCIFNVNRRRSISSRTRSGCHTR